MDVVIPFLSSLVSLLFAIAVFDQFLARRRPYQLVWSLGLLLYCLATGSEFFLEAFGLRPFPYRLWYATGAMFAAAYLGMGTIYLLAPLSLRLPLPLPLAALLGRGTIYLLVSRRAAHITLSLLLLASLFALYRVFTSPLDLAQLPSGELLSGKAFPSGWAGPRLLTPFFNIFGSIALIGGALYSAWVFWRHRLMPHRVVSNILIAVGAFFPVIGGSLSRFGRPEFLYLFELVGIAVIFAGFLRSREVFGLYRWPLVHGFHRQAP